MPTQPLNKRFGALRSLLADPYTSPEALLALLTQAQVDDPERFASAWAPYLSTQRALPTLNITSAEALKAHALTCLPLRLCYGIDPLTKKVARQLARCPALAQVRELCFSRAIEPGALDELLKSPHLGSLEVLIFKHGAQLKKQDAQRLAQHPVLRTVHTLCFMSVPSTLSSGHILLSSPHLTQLSRLIWLGHSNAKAPASLDAWSVLEKLHQRHPLTHLSLLLSQRDEALSLAQWGGASSLRSLDLRFSHGFSQEVVQLFEQVQWPHLESLFINCQNLNVQVMETILKSDFASNLRALMIVGYFLEDTSALLFGAKTLTALTHLNLYANALSPSQLSQLAANEAFSTLERLDAGMLRQIGADKELAALLEPHFALRSLTLRASSLSGEFLAKLLSSRMYQRLEQLDLSQHHDPKPELFDALAHRDILPALRVLKLAELPLTLEHLDALRQWAHIGALRQLDLSDCSKLSQEDLSHWQEAVPEPSQLSILRVPNARLQERVFSFTRDLVSPGTSFDGLNVPELFAP